MLKKLIALILFFFVSLFIGYEHPILIETPKKYLKFFLKKINLKDEILLSKEEILTIEKEKFLQTRLNPKVIEGNSFDLVIEKKVNFDDRTAGFFIDQKEREALEFEIFLQNGVKINNNSTKEVPLPIDISFKNNGGLKSVFKYNDEIYLYTSNEFLNCRYASISLLKNQKILLKTKCLPDFENVDFNGLGGGFVEKGDNLLFSVGAPEWNSFDISNLAQNKDYLYGKILELKKNFFKSVNQNKEFKIFSSGHKNPQGLAILENKIFSIEHGPQGGDEINLIKDGNNYGWPLVSYGTRYNSGKGYEKTNSNFVKPLYTFLPSIAPSSLAACPKNLNNYFKDDLCLMSLSLRGMSLYVILIDKTNLNLISLEKFNLEKRLRHFGFNKKKVYYNKNKFYVSADGDGIYSAEFIALR